MNICKPTLFVFVALAMTVARAETYFVATDGDDRQAGTMEQPFASIQRAQEVVAAGDTVFLRGGVYRMTEEQIARKHRIWAYVIDLHKSGRRDQPIRYWAYQNEQPVFDFSAVKPDRLRVHAFAVSGSWLHLRGIEVVGVQVTLTGHTQSVCFANNGNHNIFERLSMHDGMAIGVYSVRGSDNLFLNCDAYRNDDPVSGKGRGGNVDGFGCHPTRGGTNNIFRGCRAWWNSDDGFDCINASESVTFENCWAFWNGYTPDFQGRADGNGFKVGGYASTPVHRLPKPIPRHTTRHCVAVHNRSSGFYANHHIGGNDWLYNSAYRNGVNFNFLSRLDDNVTDVPGYGHRIAYNLSFGSRRLVTNLDAEKNQLQANAFGNSIELEKADFQSLDEEQLTQPRKANGELPEITLLQLKGDQKWGAFAGRQDFTHHPRFLASLEARQVTAGGKAVSPDGRYAIAQTFQSETIAYDLTQQVEIGHWPDAASRYEYSADSKILLRMHADTLSLHDADSLKTLASWHARPKLPRPAGEFLQLNACLSPDGTLVAIENRNRSFDHADDADILVRDVQTGATVQRIVYPFCDEKPISQRHFRVSFVGFNDRLLVQQLTYAPGRSYLRSAVINLTNGELLCEFPYNSTLRFNGDRSQIAAAECSTRSDTYQKIESPEASEVGVFSVRSGTRLQLIETRGAIRDFDLDVEGRRLITSVQTVDAPSPDETPAALPDRGARLTQLTEWDVESGDSVGTQAVLPLPVAQLRYATDPSKCIVAMERPDGVDDGLELVVEVRDLTSGERLSDEGWLRRGSLDNLHDSLFLFPDGQRFIKRNNAFQVQSFPEGETVWKPVPRRHTVEQAAFSPDGRYVWTDDFLTELASGRQRRWLDADDVKFVLDGEAVFYRYFNEVGVLSTASNQKRWQQGFQWNGRVVSADISADARRVAVILERDRFSNNGESPPRMVVLLDREAQDRPRTLAIDARCLVFDSTGNTLFVATDAAVQRIDFASGSSLGAAFAVPGDTLAMQCGPEGIRLLVAGQSASELQGYRNVLGSGWLLYAQLDTGKIVELHKSGSPITAAAISADGTTLAAGNLASDSTPSLIWLWDAHTLQPKQTIDGHRLSINDLAFHPDGQMLLAAADDGAALWDVRDTLGNGQTADESVKSVFPRELTPIETANAYTGEIRKIDPYEGPWLIPASEDPQAKDADKTDWPLIQLNSARDLETTSALFDWVSGAKARYHVSAKIDWDSPEAKWLRSYEFGMRTTDWQHRLAFDKSQRDVVLLTEDGEIVQRFPSVAGLAHTALSPSAQRVAIVPLDRGGLEPSDRRIQVEVYDARSGEKERSMALVEGVHVSLMEWETQNRFLHVNDNQRAVLVFDVQTGELLARFQSEQAAQLHSRLAPDGRYLATSERFDDAVVLRDPNTLAEVKRLPMKFTVAWMRWTPGSDRLIAGQSFGDGLELVECVDVESGQVQWSRRMAAARDVDFDQAGEWMLSEPQLGSSLAVLCRVSDGTIAAAFLTTGSTQLERPWLSKAGGTVYLGASIGPRLWPPSQPPLHAEVRRAGSQVKFFEEADVTIVDIVSDFGIAGTTIQRTAPQWPKSIRVRLHLQGLELFRVDNGPQAVEWSVSSGGPHETRVSLRSNQQETALDTDSPYHTPVHIVNGNQGIPLRDGYFEVPLPAKLFENNPETLELRWIDFYRN